MSEHTHPATVPALPVNPSYQSYMPVWPPAATTATGSPAQGAPRPPVPGEDTNSVHTCQNRRRHPMSTYQSQHYVSPADEPDVKRARAKRRRRTATAVAVAVVALCGAGSIIATLTGDGAADRVGAAAASAPTRTPAGTPATTAAQPAKQTTPPAPPPAPKDRKYSGRGDKVLKVDVNDGHVWLATITHTGTSNIAVWTVDALGEQRDLLVNDIGRYSGTRPVNVDAGGPPVTALRVEASGKWTITLKVAEKAAQFDGDVSGTGDQVLLVPDGVLSGLTVAKVTHRGEGNFAVWAVDHAGQQTDLLVNELDAYTGEVQVPAGTALLDITAGGKWTITLS